MRNVSSREGAQVPGPRIGVLSVYFGLFDDAMPASFRRDRLAYSETFARHLERIGEVVFPELVDDENAGRRVGAGFAHDHVDVVVCAPSMAAPPSYAWAALEAVPDVPVVVAVGQEERTVPDDYDTEAATRRSLPVGAVMITNVLARRGRAFTTVVGSIGDDRFWGDLAATINGVAAAARLRRSPILAIGDPIAGYWDVEATDEEFGRLGISPDRIGIDELALAFRSVDADDLQREHEAVERRFDVDAVAGDVLERSERLAVALRSIVAGRGAVGGAVNCHGDLFRFGDEIGITACLAVTRLSDDGIPFACTGDVPTGVALVLGRSIADWALYCELYQLDLEGDWLLVANGGEGDPSAARPETPPCLLPEDHYAGLHGAGVAVSFPVATGAATLMSLSPMPDADGGWALVIGEGEVLDARHVRMEGPNAMFRFGSGSVADAYRRWCEAGATHHAALLEGRRGPELEAAARSLGIEVRRV